MHTPNVIADLLLDHEEFQRPLADALAAAERIMLDPTSESTSDEVRTVQRFIRNAIDHMNAEERQAFPRALGLGAPYEIVTLMVRDHELLRGIGARIERALADSDETPLGAEFNESLRRFIHLFEWHIDREERLFAQGNE